MFNRLKDIDTYLFLSICLIPFFLFSSFISDLLVCISGLLLIIVAILKKYNFLKNKFFIVFSLWYLYLISLSFFSENIYLSLESTLFYFRFGILSMCIVYLDQKYINFKKYFLIFIIIILFILFIDSIIQLITNYSLIGYRLDNNRISSLFGDEKILGSFTIKYFILFISLFIFTNNKKKFFNVIFFIVTLICLCLVLLSSERVAFFQIILIIIFIQLYVINSFKLFLFNSTIILTTILTLLFLLPQTKHRLINETFHQFNFSFFIDSNNYKELHIFSETYQDYYKVGYEIFKDNYIIGIGPKMYREYCAKDKYSIVADHNACSTHPHNTYIQLLSETGLIGTFFILMIWIYTLIYISYYTINIKNVLDHYIYKYKLALIFGLFLILFPFMPTGNFFHNHNNIYNFIIIGFLISIFQKNLIIKSNE